MRCGDGPAGDGGKGDEADDGDDGMMVIEEDVVPQPSPVRAGRYRDLFARLRRGGG